MSHIRSRNTKPEVKLRKELFRLGYRYRLNVKGLDRSPDIVLAKADFRHTVSETQRQLDINRESWLEEMADRKDEEERKMEGGDEEKEGKGNGFDKADARLSIHNGSLYAPQK